MTRTIETDLTTSWILESNVSYDRLEDESGAPITTETGDRIYVGLATTSRDKEQDTTTSRTYL